MRLLKEGIEAGSASLRPAPRRPTTIKARDFMTTDVVVFRTTQTLSEAIDVMVGRKLSGAPVLDEQGKVVGVLSEFDCMKVMVASSFHQEGMPGMRAISELMSRKLHFVDPDADLYTISHLFITHRIRRVPVLDHGALVGLVSRRDIVRAMHTLIN
jgi:CBS domain-containing protein